MKNKILLFGLIVVIMAFTVAFGYTNARYSSTASMTGDLDYIKTIGKISIYNPGWIGGYTGPDDGSGVFEVSQVPLCFSNIHYSVTNKYKDEINGEETSYYIRVVANDGSEDIPIKYDVHEYNNPANVYNLEEGVGYGPFKLSANTEEIQNYSIKADFDSTDPTHISSVQNLKVQMVKKRSNGEPKVIDEAPLNLQYTGDKVRASIGYYLYGTSAPAVKVGESQVISMDDNFTLDFKNATQLAELGINMPSGYIFHDVRHVKDGVGDWSGTSTSISISEGYCLSGFYIEVYLTSNTDIAVQLEYFDYTKYTIQDGKRVYERIKKGNNSLVQTLSIPRGTYIDFTNEAQRNLLGINLPTGYTLQGLNGNLISSSDMYNVKSVNIPNTTTDIVHLIEVYMNPSGSASVNLSYYDSSNNLIGTQTLSDVDVGTNIDFTNSSVLTSLGINLPTNYKFNKAYCSQLDSSGEGKNSFMIPYNGVGQTYNINVVLDAVVQGNQTLEVTLSNGNKTTITLNADGTYDFNAHNCCELFGMTYGPGTTSFTIRVWNVWNSSYDVGHTPGGNTVTLDYNKEYGDLKICLKDEGSWLQICYNGW